MRWSMPPAPTIGPRSRLSLTPSPAAESRSCTRAAPAWWPTTLAATGSDRIYDEDTLIEPVPGKAARVAIDRLIIDAAAGGLRSVVLCNSLIYGTGRGLHPDSVQIPVRYFGFRWCATRLTL